MSQEKNRMTRPVGRQDVAVAETSVLCTRSDSRLSPENRVELIDLLQQQYARTTDLHANLQRAHWVLRNVSFKTIRHVLGSLVLTTTSHLALLSRQVTALGGYAPAPCLEVAQDVFEYVNALDFADCIALIQRDSDALEMLAGDTAKLLAHAAAHGERVEHMLDEVQRGSVQLVERIRHALMPEAPGRPTYDNAGLFQRLDFTIA